MKSKKGFIYIFFIFLFSSCSSEHTYEMEIKNNTQFHIDSLTFGCAFERKSISIEPYGKANIELVYKDNMQKYIITHLFTEALLCYSISDYSDTLNNYQNKHGYTMGKSFLKDNEKNVMNITIDTSQGAKSDIFDFDINK